MKLGTLLTDFKTKVVADAEAVKAFLIKVSGEAPAAVQKITSEAQPLETLLEAFVPGSTKIVNIGNAVLAQAAQAVEDAGAAAGANGVSVVLDKTVVADLQGIIAAAKAAAGTPATTEAPATPAPLPTAKTTAATTEEKKPVIMPVKN